MRTTLRWSARTLVALLFAQSFAQSMAGAEQLEFSFTSSYDGSEQLAFALIPDSLADDEPRPLLVLAHHAWGNRHSQSYYYPEIEKRGWMLVVPELHGKHTDGRFSLSAIEAQHDLIDALDYMQANYPVDESRIYLAGRSMGGMLSAVTAAKYPGRFAAVVAGQGVYDFRTWREWRLPLSQSATAGSTRDQVDSLLSAELGGPFSPETAHAYVSHSALTFASNLQYVPLILWHGTLDEITPPEQSARLAQAIQQYDRYQPDPHWLRGASHLPINLPPSWVLDQLQHHRNVGLRGWRTRFYPQLDLITDEAKRILWLEIEPAAVDGFGRVVASVTDGLLAVRGEEVASVTVQLDEIPEWIRFDHYEMEGAPDLQLHIARGDSVLFTATTDTPAGALPALWASQIEP